MALEAGDFGSSGMLITCYTALGNHEATRRAAEITRVAQKRFWRTILTTARRWATAVCAGRVGSGRASKRLDGSRPADRSRKSYRCVTISCAHWPITYTTRRRPWRCSVRHSKRWAAGLINHAKIDPDLGSLCGTTRASKRCWPPPSGVCPNPVRERGMGVELKSPPAAVHADYRPER